MVHSFSMVHCNGSEQWFSVERRPRKKERKEAGQLGGGMVGWGASFKERAVQRAHHPHRSLQGLVYTMGEFELRLGRSVCRIWAVFSTLRARGAGLPPCGGVLSARSSPFHVILSLTRHIFNDCISESAWCLLTRHGSHCCWCGR